MANEGFYAEMVRDVLRKEFREELRSIMREEFQEMMKEFAKAHELPPMLTRTEMMTVLRITNNKAAELIARPDFPVMREAGLLFPKDKLFQWIDRNTRWVEDNTGYFRAV